MTQTNKQSHMGNRQHLASTGTAEGKPVAGILSPDPYLMAGKCAFLPRVCSGGSTWPPRAPGPPGLACCFTATAPARTHTFNKLYLRLHLIPFLSLTLTFLRPSRIAAFNHRVLPFLILLKWETFSKELKCQFLSK